jgi:hypothetical protein
LAKNYENFRKSERGRVPQLFAEEIGKLVGLCDDQGRRYTREDGFPTLKKDAKFRPSDFNLRIVTEAILGQDWAQVLDLESSGRAFPVQRWLREESASPIGPSTFANVAAWSATVGGLMNAAVLEGYQQSAYDVADMFPTRPTVFWQGGERYINILGPYEPAPVVGPGENHPSMKLDALWVEPGVMRKYGASIEVTKETAYIDITGGQIMARAKELGQSLKFRENELALDIITGQTNNWKMGMLLDASATTYNTYGPTITNPKGTSRTIPNDLTNPLNDIGAFTNSDLQIANLYHPVTDNPIDVQMDTVLLPTPLMHWAQWLMGADQLTAMTQTTAAMAQAAPGTFPNMSIQGKNPWQGVLKPVVSRWLHARHVASTTQPDANRTAGLGLTGAAVYRWYRLDPAQFAARRAAWEATVVDLNPSDYTMAKQGIIAGQVGNIAVMYQVLNPYAIQRNKGA